MPGSPTRLDVLTSGPRAVAEDAYPALLAEATWQLDVCNSCRYCEGFCAVFPALARRAEVGAGDVTQLANLCHDCRACHDACMYSPPHEFELELPKVLSAVRLADYGRYVWPTKVPRLLKGWAGVVVAGLLATVIVLVLAVIHAGWSGLTASDGTAASPYGLIPYGVLLALMFSATGFALAVTVVAGRRYWREAGPTSGSFGKATLGAVGDAVTMRYMRGGGEDCYYPEEDQPSGVRRHLHGLVAWGFALCLLSTAAAAFSQEILGDHPPYPWLSVPVIAGTLGGIGLVLGCVGLLRLKAQSSEVTSFAQMDVKDYGLLVALTYLALTGLAVLLTRSTAAFPIVLLVHLSAVAAAIALAPYSKFVHVLFRFLALVHDRLEREAAASGRS